MLAIEKLNHKLDTWITPEVVVTAATAIAAIPSVSRFDLRANPTQIVNLHVWVRKHKPIPPECFICKQFFPKNRLQLCNISKSFNLETYDERLENWFYACSKCHNSYGGCRNKYGRSSKLKFNLRLHPHRYYSLHSWMRIHLPKPSECSICKQSFPKNKLQLCNISKGFNYDTYDKRLENWFYACCKCHRNYDDPWSVPGRRERISEANKGEKSFWYGKSRSEEQRKKLSENKKAFYANGGKHNMQGKHHSEKTKKQLSELFTGKPLSEEHRRKIGDAQRGEKNGFYHKQHTEETKRKISDKRKGKFTGKDNPFYGKHHTEETKLRHSEAMKGRHLSQEHKEKLRGKHHSEDTRRKISETLKARHNRQENLLV